MEIGRENNLAYVWKVPLTTWAAMLATAGLLGFVFYDGIEHMVGTWASAEYSHAYLIPVITAFLIWQKKDLLETNSFKGSWVGLLVVGIGIGTFFLGKLSTLHIIVEYAFLIVIAGLALALTGWRNFKLIGIPLALLFFMVPLPAFLYQNLSSELQLISSQIGVAVIRLFGISVFLDGNVIDLGSFKLEVVEACSGLRYLFPLMTLGFIVAYFFKEAFWKRAIIFLSTIPITVLMNSFRIGMIGVMVEYGGLAMAEGFIHDFEGWVVFMACITVLVIEMWILTRIAVKKPKRPLQEVFGLELPGPTPKNAVIQSHPLSGFFLGSTGLLAVVAVLSHTLPERVDVIPPRENFSAFPMTHDTWNGQRGQLDKIYVDALKFTDYILADYNDGDDKHPVNLYIVYYDSQRTSESAHSPRSCIPGGGWQIASFTKRDIDGAIVAGSTLRVNRTLIKKGEHGQLVYYWFQQRGRVITNEYLVKWYLFWDALTRNRTDGALVRLVTNVQPGQVDEADARLTGFAKVISRDLNKYIPD
jgi:exosortase D (VPLPA-CTERM-specific)